MDNREPTKEVIGAALKRAQQLIKDNNMHINEALAAATTSAQCQGFMGFKVFAQTRDAVTSVIGPKVSYDLAIVNCFTGRRNCSPRSEMSWPHITPAM